MDATSREGHPYQVVAADLASKIRQGTFRPHDKLPSVRTLAKDYGVTVTTVQRAMRSLTDDGLIRTHSGLGSYVADAVEEVQRGETVDSLRHDLQDLRAALHELSERVTELESRGR